jgi:hypothetical protein
MVLSGGTLIASGPTNEILANTALLESAGL